MTQNQIRFYEAREQARSNRANEREQFRSHTASEREANRSNLARETETSRSNRANEALKNQQNIITAGYNAGMLAETERAHRMNEALQATSIAETNRHNVAGEDVSRYSAEKQASVNEFNAATNRLTAFSNATLNSAKTENVKADTSRVQAQTGLYNQQATTSKAQMYNYIAGTQLAQEQAKYYGAQSVSGTAENWATVGKEVLNGIKAAKQIAGFLF